MTRAELVRRSYRLFEEGRLDEWVDCYSDDAEIPALALVGREAVYRGRDGLRQWLAELRESGTQVRSFDDEYVDAADGRVVVLGRIVVEHPGQRGFGTVAGWIYTFSGDAIARVEVYPHPGLALEAAGLAPPDQRIR